MLKFSYLKSVNAEYIDELFGRYLKDPDSIDETWRYFFDGMELGIQEGGHASFQVPEAAEQTAAKSGANGAAPVLSLTPKFENLDLSSEAKVAELINAYRSRGRLIANINPLTPPPSTHASLDLDNFDLKPEDLARTFTAGKLIGLGPVPLREIIAKLKETYCSSIGVEFTHIQDRESRVWLMEKMEASRNRESLDPATRKHILKRLTESETFERFLHTRYVAQKRFSIEGGESLIPCLDRVFETGAELGAENFVLGMAHRGRLNVLVNTYGKKPQHVFTEFEDNYMADTSMGEGDVKYHMGYSSDLTTRTGKSVHLSLASNPSHLEFVNPVVEGTVRGKQRYLADTARSRVIPVLIHGDAAFAGQGVVYETLNLSQLEGYSTGGTVHIVINNQVGFTTSPAESRSTNYCTDLAKMLEVPIFHINGDDPEALWYAAGLMMEYRQRFHKDVVIDLICYRKYGHNEGDEPAFTQPLMYAKIKAHPSTREIYAQKLIDLGLMKPEETKAMVDQIMDDLGAQQEKARAEGKKPPISAYQSQWQQFHRATAEEIFARVDTTVAAETIRALSEKINRVPEGFHLHPKLTRFFDARMKAVQEGKGIDWGNGELLAYASLLHEGHAVRLSGQDVKRGTFTHRHAVLTDFESGKSHTPLAQLEGPNAQFSIFNSHLSETAVMGFEYGWSLADPGSLVIWEAQFGDFANGAQVIIDQFIAAAESKWQRASGLVLLLPHGYEGQGPEHSSARLERFLQLCGKYNMFVCNFTTPAQIFHALRRQVKWGFRKPLVVMTPKSLLRHPLAISELADFTDRGFQEIIDDPKTQKATARKVLLCTGKVYYDLLAEREARGLQDVAIVRIEQLYPWPAELLLKTLSGYSADAKFCWVQEEPRNMGAWTYVFSQWSGGYEHFQDRVSGRSLQYIGRDIGAAPAVGSSKIHAREQKEIIERALAP